MKRPITCSEIFTFTTFTKVTTFHQTIEPFTKIKKQTIRSYFPTYLFDLMYQSELLTLTAIQFNE